MTKDLKIATLTLLFTAPLFIYLIFRIYDIEYPSSKFINSLEEGSHEYIFSSLSDSFKITLSLEDQINKTISFLAESNFENRNIDIKGDLTFNPLGQLFVGKLLINVDQHQKRECNISGTKPILIICKDTKTQVPFPTITIDNPITLNRKPNNKYFVAYIDPNDNTLISNLIQFAESTHSTDSIKIKLHSTFDQFPLIKNQLNELINDIS